MMISMKMVRRHDRIKRSVAFLCSLTYWLVVMAFSLWDYSDVSVCLVGCQKIGVIVLVCLALYDIYCPLAYNLTPLVLE